ncbi:MAG: hypothetical protein V2J55_20280 [Candidatus Competibacteraceae bacterium]|jgi:hypothetical protein|nr:hypothetical protein [Candidatus Competibacteraceae bacterium]
MHSIRTDYRIATILLFVIGATITILVLTFGHAVADQPLDNSAFKPDLKVAEVQNYSGTFLTVVHAARMMSKLATPQPLDTSADSSMRDEEATSVSKQRKLARLLAYHKAINGSLITDNTHYAIAEVVEHQPSPLNADVDKSQVEKATIAKAVPVTSKSFVEITDTML